MATASEYYLRMPSVHWIHFRCGNYAIKWLNNNFFEQFLLIYNCQNFSVKYFVKFCSKIIDEVSEYDAKNKDMPTQDAKHRMKDYKKTSIWKGIVVFEEFLHKLEETWKGKRLEASGKYER